MKIDLHMHSTASDGRLSPKELVDWALEKKIPAIAITDHESVDGAREAVEYAKGKDIEVVSGIEIGAGDKGTDDYDAHIVGLFLDLENKDLAELLKKLMKAKEVQKREIILRLNKLGYEITFEELKEEVGSINFGRPHVARILMKRYKKFKEVQDVFDELLGYNGKVHVRQKKETIRKTIEFIHGAGGIAILAHPMLSKNAEEVVDRFIEAEGDGIEVNYFYENRAVGKDRALEMIEWVLNVAKEKGLVVSGGGDFHSKDDPHEIGDCGLSVSEFEDLKKYWKEKWKKN